MTDLLICAAVVAFVGWSLSLFGGARAVNNAPFLAHVLAYTGLALIAVALWLAYAAGAQP